MKLVTTNPLFVDLLIGDLDPSLISRGIEHRFHLQPASGSGRAHPMDHTLVVPERLPFPSQTDKREQPMLNPIPLAGSRRIVRHGDRNSDLIGPFQQIRLPGTGTTGLAPTSIGTNQQTSGRTLPLPPVQPPPPPNTFYRKFRRVMADPYMDHRPIPLDIIDAVGNGLAWGPGRPIMPMDLVRLPWRSPRPTPIFKRLPRVLSSSYPPRSPDPGCHETVLPVD